MVNIDDLRFIKVISQSKTYSHHFVATPKPSQSSKLNLGALLSVPVRPSRPISIAGPYPIIPSCRLLVITPRPRPYAIDLIPQVLGIPSKAPKDLTFEMQIPGKTKALCSWSLARAIS